MTLREARVAFTKCIALLIQHAFVRGYEIAIDEATEHITAKDPTSDHRRGSCHHIGLAVDMLLYQDVDQDGDMDYLVTTPAYSELGQYWESLHPLARWGGHFSDGNHFSFEWEGRK